LIIFIQTLKVRVANHIKFATMKIRKRLRDKRSFLYKKNPKRAVSPILPIFAVMFRFRRILVLTVSAPCCSRWLEHGDCPNAQITLGPDEIGENQA